MENVLTLRRMNEGEDVSSNHVAEAFIYIGYVSGMMQAAYTKSWSVGALTTFDALEFFEGQCLAKPELSTEELGGHILAESLK